MTRSNRRPNDGRQPAELLSGFAEGSVGALLRAEGLVAAAAAIIAYYAMGGDLAFFLLTFLVPDLSMTAYLVGPVVGAVAYNIVHTYLLAAALALLGWLWGSTMLELLAAVWAAHIGVDRAFGYGLKYPDAFGRTHLGLIGGLKKVGSRGDQASSEV